MAHPTNYVWRLGQTLCHHHVSFLVESVRVVLQLFLPYYAVEGESGVDVILVGASAVEKEAEYLRGGRISKGRGSI